MTALAPLEAYRRWAPTYARETAITVLDEALVAELGPSSIGKRLLDAGCGTGRRLREADAAEAVGVEPCAEMIAAGAEQGAWPVGVRVIEGDVLALPLASGGFDIVWCRLVLGHVGELRLAYAELARMMAPEAVLVVTDFHADAHAAGHRRTFRDGDGVHEVEHHVHDPRAHLEAAFGCGLALAEMSVGRVGDSIRDYYERADRLADYEAQYGLPLVLGLSFRKRI
jgi:malonyl-CoA O-methyltransferase